MTAAQGLQTSFPSQRQLPGVQDGRGTTKQALSLSVHIQNWGWARPGQAIACPASAYSSGQMGMERRLPGNLDASQKQTPTAQQKPLSIISAEFYINGNFQLSCSTVSVRGLGTRGISHRRTLWQNRPSWDDRMTPSTTQRECTGSLHAKTSPAESLPGPGRCSLLAGTPLWLLTAGFHQRPSGGSAETSSIFSTEAQRHIVS